MNIPKERPILVSGPLIQPILSGEKTQTRRLMANLPSSRSDMAMHHIGLCIHSGKWTFYDENNNCHSCDGGIRCPFGQPGDRLWVRESWMPGYDHQSIDQGDDKSICEVIYRGPGDANVSEFRPAPDDVAEEWVRNYSEDGDDDPRWRPSIHMPRWASRINLEVTEVRAQRLQDISEEDARAEGIHEHPAAKIMLDAKSTHVGAFLMAWNAINGKRPGASWEDNPWVWAVSFKLVQP